MEKIYVIVACNNEAYEDRREGVLGFVETKQEAKRIIDVLKRTQIEDSNIVNELESRCDGCDAALRKCLDCSSGNEINRIEDKDMYHLCNGRPGSVSYIDMELKKMF